MYFAPNVRASLRDHVTRFARSAQKFIFWVEKKKKKMKRFVKRRMRKLQKTTLQDRRESRSIEIAFNLINQSGYRLTFIRPEIN